MPYFVPWLSAIQLAKGSWTHPKCTCTMCFRPDHLNRAHSLTTICTQTLILNWEKKSGRSELLRKSIDISFELNCKPIGEWKTIGDVFLLWQMSREAYFTGESYLGSTAKMSPFDNFEGGLNFRTLQPSGLLFYHSEGVSVNLCLDANGK